jgi:hypothetical protein
LELIGVQDPQVLIRGMKKPGEIIPQERKSEVGCHADRFRQAIADELFDDAVRYDDRDLIERLAALVQGDSFGQRRDQIFESIGVVETNHRGPAITRFSVQETYIVALTTVVIE